MPYRLQIEPFKLAGVKGCTKCKYGNYLEVEKELTGHRKTQMATVKSQPYFHSLLQR
jgi:predicted nucleic-acid-binding Zn-ribbon protein